MANQIPMGNAGLVAAVLTPSVSYGQMAAARQERFQLQNLLTQQSEAKLAEEQQAVAQEQQYMQTLGSLPFVGRDVQKLGAHLKAEQKALFDRLYSTYNGNFKQFWQAEGEAWKSGAAQRLQQSPFYQQAVQNRLNVDQARKAIAEGKVLNGSGTGLNDYQFGEKLLSKFESGQADAFTFNGAYKPEDDVKELRATYAPGRYPWERVQVSDGEVMAHLRQGNDGVTAIDKYLRQYRGVPVFYKTDTLDKKVEFGWKAEDQQMQKQAHQWASNREGRSAASFGMDMKLKGQQLTKNALSIAKAQQEMSGVDATGRDLPTRLAAEASVSVPLAMNPNDKENKRLPYSGLNLPDFFKAGKMVGSTLYGDMATTWANKLGLTKTAKGYEGSGRIKEGFTDMNGVHAFDLSQSRFKVLDVEPTIYFNPSQLGQGRIAPGGINGFSRVTVQFDSNNDAEKAGLYNEQWYWPNSSTRAGTGVYTPGAPESKEPGVRTATFFVPAGKFDKQNSPLFVTELMNNFLGQKRAGAEYDSGSMLIGGDYED